MSSSHVCSDTHIDGVQLVVFSEFVNRLCNRKPVHMHGHRWCMLNWRYTRGLYAIEVPVAGNEQEKQKFNRMRDVLNVLDVMFVMEPDAVCSLCVKTLNAYWVKFGVGNFWTMDEVQCYGIHSSNMHQVRSLVSLRLRRLGVNKDLFGINDARGQTFGMTMKSVSVISILFKGVFFTDTKHFLPEIIIASQSAGELRRTVFITARSLVFHIVNCGHDASVLYTFIEQIQLMDSTLYPRQSLRDLIACGGSGDYDDMQTLANVAFWYNTTPGERRVLGMDHDRDSEVVVYSLAGVRLFLDNCSFVFARSYDDLFDVVSMACRELLSHLTHDASLSVSAPFTAPFALSVSYMQQYDPLTRGNIVSVDSVPVAGRSGGLAASKRIRLEGMETDEALDPFTLPVLDGWDDF